MAQPIAVKGTAEQPAARPRYERLYVWQLPIRLFHWIFALSIIVLFLTGLYIGTPILSTSGEPFDNFLMARIRQIHFAAAYVFAGAFVWRVYWFFAGNQFARTGFPYAWRPSWWRDLFRQFAAYVKLGFGPPHLGHNALAGLSYTLAPICLGLLQILTGFALYSESDPDGFWGRLTGWVIPLLGGSFRTHMWHHFFAWMFIWFALAHIYIVMLDSRQYRNGLIGSMITGFKFRRIRPGDDE